MNPEWLIQRLRATGDALIRTYDPSDAIGARILHALADDMEADIARLREEQYAAQGGSAPEQQDQPQNGEGR